MPIWERAGPPSPIYVSLVIGGEGSENRTAIAAADAIGRLADQVSESIEPDGLQVDLTFHIGGSIVKPDYEGVRTGSYLPKHQLLVVQAAVPVPLPADVATVYMKDVLEEILRLVQGYVARRKLKVSTTTVESVLNQMVNRVSDLRFDAT